MSHPPGPLDRLAGAQRVVVFIGEILAVATALRSLAGTRPPTTMERTPRPKETRCAVT
ncbi:MAG: hypothetical protein WHS89_14370 [Acidimicrobiales bacterium]